MKKRNNIALIFFSRTKADEARQKSWFRVKSKNQELAQLLIERASSAIKASGIPVFHFDEQKQIGNSFGERIANAYQEVFDLGYEQVISVGNDCPDLKNINWEEITQALSSGKSVLGPDIRGGAYLIGIQKTEFDKTKFENLSWQKNTLYSALKEFCSSTSKLTELTQFRDLNSLHDIQIISFARNSEDHFFKLISRLLISRIQSPVESKTTHHDFQIFKDSPLRAPPFLKAS